MWIASLGKRSNVTLSTNAAAAAVVFMSKATLAKAFESALMAGICLRLLALVGRGGRRRQACGRFCERLVMADAERLDPALLPERQCDEKAELDQLRDAEVLVQFCPQRVVGDIGVPDDGAGIGQRGLLALGEFVRRAEVQEFVVLPFRQSFPSSLDGSLHASIFAVNRFRDVNAAKLLQRMIDDAVSESQIPRLGERANDVGIVRPDRLALGARRAFALRAIEVPSDLGVGDGREIDVRYSRHRSPRKLFRCRHHCLLRILYRTTCAVFPHEHRKIALAGAALRSGLTR